MKPDGKMTAFEERVLAALRDALLPAFEEQTPTEEPKSDIDCAAKIFVRGDTLRLTFMCNGQNDIVASSLIKGDGFLDFVKAFSYAAHMCYKLAEQRELNGEG